tara:strand:+ start:430 stop:543 length:114 start_codon:yes stop_codon:yes gene_type:complete
VFYVRPAAAPYAELDSPIGPLEIAPFTPAFAGGPPTG